VLDRQPYLSHGLPQRLIYIGNLQSLIRLQEQIEVVDFCIRCHLPNGKGQIGIIPPLAKSDFLYEHMEESIKALKFGGIDGEIIVNGVKYNSRMEKMGLYNDEIADVMNYILNSWGNKSDLMITEEYVDKLKK